MGKIKSVAQLGADKKFGLPVPFSVDLEQIDISDNLKATLTQSNITVSEENMEAVVTELVEMAADQKTILDKVPVTKGGTGKNSITQGNILVGGANNTFEEKGIDTIPTSGSRNLVSSGGVYTALSNLPPKNHASTTTEYGIGNNLGFGHVKISDDYKNTSAENGVAASHNALVNAYTELNNAILNSEGGGGNNLSVDIPITLTSGGWTGTSAPYQQTVSVLAIREGMTPLFFLGGNSTDDEQYAFSLITGYSVANTEITFYAADSPSVDINIILKGIPAQKIDSEANGVVIVIVEPSAFAMNDETGRYEATVAVEGMTAGLGGVWDIVRSGSVLTEAESKIALNITDVERLDGAIRIVSLEIPSARFMMSIQGSPVAASDGDIILSGMQEWFAKVDSLEVMKREQMAPYGYFGIEWDLDELMALVRAGSWDKFAVGDYFVETTTAGEQIMWEVAGKNSYLRCGDACLTDNHIVCCPRDCLETYYKFNTSHTNAGGYAASLMPANLETEANKFSSKLQGYMTTIRRLENNKGAWAWASRRIFLPGIVELCGSNGFADGYSGGAFNQLQLFTGGNAHILKGAGFNKKKAGRVAFWTADPSAANTTDFCYFSSHGYSHDYGAAGDFALAPLIVLS